MKCTLYNAKLRIVLLRLSIALFMIVSYGVYKHSVCLRANIGAVENQQAQDEMSDDSRWFYINSEVLLGAVLCDDPNYFKTYQYINNKEVSSFISLNNVLNKLVHKVKGVSCFDIKNIKMLTSERSTAYIYFLCKIIF